jgi:hypothetical protein
MKNAEWQDYIDENGFFEFSNYLYKSMNKLMKTMLDLGTLACSDSAKLRAYKEQVKTSFRDKWLDLASLLEEMGIIQPCGCGTEFCTKCGGSRYILSEILTADDVKEVYAAFNEKADDKLASKLNELVGTELFISNEEGLL